MEVGNSVHLNEDVKEDDVRNMFLCPESEGVDKLANSDEEIQSKLASKGNTKFWQISL